MIAVNQIVGRHYTIISQLGTGGMGQVYKALDKNLGREVAIKFLLDETNNEETKNRFLNEGKILATIKHSCVIGVYASDMDEKLNAPFLVMELADGKSLDRFKNDFIRDRNYLLKCFINLFDGINACHQKGIVHRDLKPANILIDKNGDLKIVDFGIAKTSLKQTRTGIALGTPHYMSPEQCLGKPEITAKSDIYSIGIMLWEFLTGNLPFRVYDEATDPALSIAMKHLNEPPPLDDLKKHLNESELITLLPAMLSKKPEDRPGIAIIIETLKREIAKQVSSDGHSEPATGKQAQNDTIGEIYKIQSLIGSGGMGKVYKALDISLNRVVAVKVLNERAAADNNLVERFLKEGRLLATIGHPNVLGIYASSRDKTTGAPFLVMEYIDGALVSELKPALVKDKPRLAPLMLQLCEGINACHEKGVIHRDLKPSNLMVTREGVLKIFDFGIAKTPEPMTKTGTTVGTPQYMSPEQCLGMKELTVKSDIYSIGVILWELIYGEPPFEADIDSNPELSIAVKQIQATLPFKALDPDNPYLEIIPLVRRMLDKEPAMRPEIQEIIEAIEEFAAKRFTDDTAEYAKKMKVKSIQQSAVQELVQPQGRGQSETGRKIYVALFFLAMLGCLCVWFFMQPGKRSVQNTTAESDSGVQEPQPSPPKPASESISIVPISYASPVIDDLQERSKAIENAMASFSAESDPTDILSMIEALASKGQASTSARLRETLAGIFMKKGESFFPEDKDKALTYFKKAAEILPATLYISEKIKITQDALAAAKTVKEKAGALDALEKSIDEEISRLHPPDDPVSVLSKILLLATQFQKPEFAAAKKTILYDKYHARAQLIQDSEPQIAIKILEHCLMIAPEKTETADEIKQIKNAAAAQSKKAGSESRILDIKKRLEKQTRSLTSKDFPAIIKALNELETLGDKADSEKFRTRFAQTARYEAEKAKSYSDAKSLSDAGASLFPANSEAKKTFTSSTRKILDKKKASIIDEVKKAVSALKPSSQAKTLAKRIKGIKDWGETAVADELTSKVKEKFLSSVKTLKSKEPEKALDLLKTLSAFDGLKNDAQIGSLITDLTKAISETKPTLPKPITENSAPKDTGINTGIDTNTDDEKPIDEPVPEEEPVPSTETPQAASTPKAEGEEIMAELENKTSPEMVESSIDEIIALTTKLEKSGGKTQARGYRERAVNALIDIGDENASQGAKDSALDVYRKALKIIPNHQGALKAITHIQ